MRRNDQSNGHPFQYGLYMFIHNGQIGRFSQLRRTMETWLPDSLYQHRGGGTDSELLFLLIDGAPPSLYLKPQRGGWAVASEPLGDDAEAWSPVLPQQLIHLHSGRQQTSALA